ncbi:lysylphosphatidylglycerol synthase transmembrane domain-containing protein [Arcicella rigui]|uniref:Lysylphosphatidylglycerol synthase transmembrane domain-containing protein n=1 Tax=Arcicella rigui TaxID=797020 RepID=A0ABU5QAJ6_9BACT|nr:lysylphosphatidylglycerol synthase transmembrane domain-containing protein [Arcicella rigui]MEA5139866.1 lysylphosphatidylglycerol synthase transmembrane domain-containing protein [Arcicella rigui]
MQNTNETNPKTSILSEKLFSLLKTIVFVLILWMLYKAFADKQQNIDNLLLEYKKIWVEKNIIKGVLLILLIFFNFGFETKKWQTLALKVEEISFKEALKGVLMGLSLGFITPANLGDYAGRMWKFKQEKRAESIGAILLGNGIQFFTSLLFGTLGLIYFIFRKEQFSTLNFIMILVFSLSLTLGFFAYLKRHLFYLFLLKIPFLKRFAHTVKILENFENQEVRIVFFWALMRYFTISIQFVLVLLIFGIDLEVLDLLAIACLVFLAKTIVPAINFLGDLGIREFSAIYFFSFYHVNTSAVIAATFVLWLINILFPVLVGSILVLKTRVSI